MVAPPNIMLKITEIKTDENTKRHLMDLGLLVNSNIMVLSKSGGNVIVKVKNGRLALHKDLARNIVVQEARPHNNPNLQEKEM